MKINRYRKTYAERKIKRLKITIITTVILIIGLLAAMVLFVTKNIQANKIPDLETVSQFEHTQVATEEDNSKLLTLVNFDHQIPDTFALNLVDYASVKCDKILVDMLNKMFEQAKQLGYNFTVTKGYVDKETQQAAHDELVNAHLANGLSDVSAEEEASKVEPQGGCSDLQTGLTVEISLADSDGSVAFETTPAYKWLYSNCIDYGFIQRYPEDKVSETRANFNPYRYRYVGVENAQKMRRLNMSFEKYYDYINSRS